MMMVLNHVGRCKEMNIYEEMLVHPIQSIPVNLGNIGNEDGRLSADPHPQAYNPGGGVWGQQGTINTPFGFTGEMEDENNLVYLRSRYYNHDTGTFLSQDPVPGSMNDPMSLNPYTYAQGNPVNRTDSSGQSPVPVSQALNDMIRYNPLEFASAVNAGMCLAQQPSPECADLLSQRPSPSIRVLLGKGCIDLRPVSPIPPGAEIFPSPIPITPTLSDFRLPLDNAQLTNCDFVARTGLGLPSRDMNPSGFPTPSPVYAPADAEVMIVDTTGDNTGLGNFVAIRVHTSNIPAGRNKWGTGYIYLGYAHLSQVNVQATAQAPFPQVTPAEPLGMTGASGTGIVHLDLTAFFVPEGSPPFRPEPSNTGTEEILPDGTRVREHEYFQSFYTLGLTPSYQPVQIDPLEIWPELAIGTTCTVPVG